MPTQFIWVKPIWLVRKQIRTSLVRMLIDFTRIYETNFFITTTGIATELPLPLL